MAAALSLATSGILGLLSYFEHGRNVRPSSIILAYLLFSILFDAARTRTIWLVAPSSLLAELFIISVIMKALIIVLESYEKSKFMLSTVIMYGPEGTSSVLNRSIFFWLNRVVWNGARTTFLPKDLYELNPEMTANSLITPFFEFWIKSKQQSRTYPSMRALLSTLKWSVLLAVFPRLVMIALTVCQPLLLNELLDYLGQSSEAISEDIGYGLIGAYALVYIGMAISTGFYWYHHYRVLTMIRGCLVSAIGWQTLKLNPDAMADSKAAVTLMSVDVERILFGLRSLHEFWAITIQVGLLTYLLERQLGVAFVVPLSIAVISSAASIWVNRSSNVRQTRWMQAAQLRIGAISSALSSIKAIKMRGLTRNMYSVIQDLRVQELKLASSFRMLLVWTAGLGYVPQFISPVITFLVFILQARAKERSFDASSVFTSLSLLLIISQSLSQTLLDLPSLLAAFGSTERIDQFLSIEPQTDFRDFPMVSRATAALEKPPQSTMKDQLVEKQPYEMPGSNDGAVKSKAIIRINHGYYGRGKGDILKDVSIVIPQSQLTLIVGPVASGKSTLCHALLGEILTSKGKIEVLAASKEIGFCSQTAHLVNGTIKNNIVGFSNFGLSWYNAVITACALSDDINDMPKRGETIIGSNGINLSGGQKHKVALARAVYARNSIIILDDVLSGLDATGANHVFWNVIGPDGLARQHGITVIFATHATQFLPFADHIIALDGAGRVAQQGDFHSLRSRHGYVKDLVITEDLVAKQVGGPHDHEKSKHEQETTEYLSSGSHPPRPAGDFAVYYYYFKAAGIWVTALLLLLVIVYAALYNVPTYWLNVWVNATNPGNLTYWGVYVTFQGLALLLLIGVAYHTFIHFITRAGSNLHVRILRSLMDAPLSFFSTTDSGIIVNRFSQDIQYVDNELPLALLTLLLTSFLALGQVVLIIASSPRVGFAFVVIAPFFYAMQKFYLRTSRQLRLLELEAKSPLYTSFLEALSGLYTLRAFGWVSKTFEVNQKLLDESQKPVYLLYMVQRWLTFVLDMIVAIVAVIVVVLSVALKSNSGPTGVALTQVISLNLMLISIVITWTTVETSIGSVSRIKSFVEHTPSEHRVDEILEPPSVWPQRGEIELNGVSAFYE